MPSYGERERERAFQNTQQPTTILLQKIIATCSRGPNLSSTFLAFWLAQMESRTILGKRTRLASFCVGWEWFGIDDRSERRWWDNSILSKVSRYSPRRKTWSCLPWSGNQNEANLISYFIVRKKLWLDWGNFLERWHRRGMAYSPLLPRTTQTHSLQFWHLSSPWSCNFASTQLADALIHWNEWLEPHHAIDYIFVQPGIGIPLWQWPVNGREREECVPN